MEMQSAVHCEINGKPAGMCITLPNLNEAIGDLGGKLLPLGWAKLLWRVKVKHPESARLMMLGIAFPACPGPDVSGNDEKSSASRRGPRPVRYRGQLAIEYA